MFALEIVIGDVRFDFLESGRGSVSADFVGMARGQAIDMPCLDLGPAQIVLQPGEAFVGYQLMAQQIRPKSFVMSIGYGECWL